MDNTLTINDLKEKFNKKTHEIDLTELERSYNEFKNELLMKRNQADEMRNELHKLNLKIYELTRNLDICNAEKRETDFNFKLTLRKLNNLEDKMRNNNENLIKHKMKQEIGVSELETLNTYAQQIALKNFEYTRKLDELETDRRNSLVFQQELINRDSKIKMSMTTLNEAFEKLQLEHKKVLDLSNKFKSAEKSNELNHFLMTEIDKLNTNKRKIEEKHIQISAKCEQLEQIVKKNPTITESNLFIKLSFLHWKKSSTYYKEQFESNRLIIEKLSISLSKQKEVNLKLMLQHEETIKQNQELQRENEKLKNKMKIPESDLPVKNEIFEVDKE